VVAPPTVVADATTQGSETSPIGLALGGSVLAASGVVALIEARRRQRLRAAAIDQRLAQPPAHLVETERLQRRLAQPELLARLDLALRAAAGDLAEQGGRVLAVEAGPAGE